MTNANSIGPTSNLFILLPPLSITAYLPQAFAWLSHIRPVNDQIATPGYTGRPPELASEMRYRLEKTAPAAIDLAGQSSLVLVLSGLD